MLFFMITFKKMCHIAKFNDLKLYIWNNMVVVDTICCGWVWHVSLNLLDEAPLLHIDPCFIFLAVIVLPNKFLSEAIPANSSLLAKTLLFRKTNLFWCYCQTQPSQISVQLQLGWAKICFISAVSSHVPPPPPMKV